MTTKSPFASKTMGGLLLVAITALLRRSGHPVSDGDAELRETIETALNAIGLLLAAYGRFSAQGPLDLSPPSAPGDGASAAPEPEIAPPAAPSSVPGTTSSASSGALPPAAIAPPASAHRDSR